MHQSFSEFSATLAAIEAGVDRQLHTGVQIYISVDGTPVLNAGAGKASAGTEFSSETISLWRSAGKPVTAAAVLKLFENSGLGPATTLSDALPETADTALSDITIKQLLTHQSGIPVIETGWPHADWSQILTTILAVESLSDHAAYQPQSTWFLLGEILRRRISATDSFSETLNSFVLQPLGMTDTWCGLPSDSESLQSRIPEFWTRERGKLVASPFGEGAWLAAPSPGGNLRGPVSSLGTFYEMLLRGGTDSQGNQFLRKSTVEEMTTRHRIAQHDETLQHVVDFGLGVIIDSNRYGVDTVPYGFGRYCSESTFGHGGSQCAMGFCDPERRLVVCWAANGFCGEGQHQRRNRAINEAIYKDLGFL